MYIFVEVKYAFASINIIDVIRTFWQWDMANGTTNQMILKVPFAVGR